LHLGGGACAIPQFLYHKIENSTHKVVEASKSVAINCSKYFEWPEKSNRFEVINA
jgi:spermidine synthase